MVESSALFSPVTSQAFTTARRRGWRSHRFAPAMVCASLSRSACSSERGRSGGAALSLEGGFHAGSWQAGGGKLPRQLVPSQGFLCGSWRRDAGVEENPWRQPAGVEWSDGGGVTVPGTQACALLRMAWAIVVLGWLGANGPVRPTTGLAWATALTQPSQEVGTAQLTFPFLLCLNPSVHFLGDKPFPVCSTSPRRVTLPAPKPTPPSLSTSRRRFPPRRATPAGSGSGFGKEMSKLLSVLMVFWTLLGGREKRLLFVLHEVRIAEHPPSERMERKRVENRLKAGKCACVALKDFDRLEKMYGIDWRREHLKIFRHRKRDVLAMLYGNWEELISGTRAYLDVEKISYDFERFPTGYERPFSIEGKSANSHTVRCDFVDVKDIDCFFKISSSSSRNARVVPNEPPNRS